MTKDARRAYFRRYYVAHRVAIIKRTTAYHQAHREQAARSTQAWRERWPERDAASRERETVKRVTRRIVLQRCFT